MCHQYKSKTQTEGDAQECCTTGNLTSKFFLNIFKGEKEKEKKKAVYKCFQQTCQIANAAARHPLPFPSTAEELPACGLCLLVWN